MQEISQPSQLVHLMENLVKKGFPRSVHLVTERGHPSGGGKWTLMDSPRLSLCLEGAGRYLIQRESQTAEIKLQRGDMIFVAPHCAMEPHPEARYRALGLVFAPQLTRFLVSEKTAPVGKPPVHRFIFSHHSPSIPDLDGKNFLDAIGRAMGKKPDDLYLRHLLATLLMKATGLLNHSEMENNSGKAQLTWRAACQFIQEHLQEPIGRQDVAAFLHLHPNHLSRLFTRFSRRSFNQYLLERRLARSQELLKRTHSNINEIAFACGFSDPNYFIRCHRRFFGKPPGKARAGL